MLFIVDRGFYSVDNLNLFSSNGNAYIIPLGKNLNTCKAAVHSLEMHDRFMYQKGRKASVVEYKEEIINGYRVLTYRDLNESASEQENYLRHMSRGDKSYTNEGFQKAKYYMGVTVLQTSLEYTLFTKSAGQSKPSTITSKTKPDTILCMQRTIIKRRDLLLSCLYLH